MLLGPWDELERDFNQHGGQHGIFEMHDRSFERRDLCEQIFEDGPK